MTDVTQPEIKLRKEAVLSYLNGNPTISKEQLKRSYSIIKNYLIYCDQLNVDPLGEAGYSVYFGSNGLLWKRVYCAREKQPLYEYKDGDELGITEASASTLKFIVDNFLSGVDLPVYIWSATHNKFVDQPQPITPYTQSEQSRSINKLHKTFDGLAEQILSCSKLSLIPKSLSVIINNNEVVDFESFRRVGYVAHTSPFNILMSSAYLLFAYYTSMNKSTIIEVRHPLKQGEKNILNKTVKHITFSAFKGRSNKQVEALVSDYSSFDDIPTTVDDKAGVLPFTIDKRTGFDFIKKLEQISLLFNPSNEKYKPLFYLVDKLFKIVPYKTNGINHLGEKLNLLTDNRECFAPYVCDLYDLATNHNKKVAVKQIINNNCTKVSKIYSYLTPKERNTYIVFLVKLFFLCFTDKSMQDVILPFEYIENDSDRTIDLKYRLKNGGKNKIAIPSRYKSFLKAIEDFAKNAATLKIKGKLYPRVSNLECVFLLPNVVKSRYDQMKPSDLNSLTANKFKRLGFSVDDFFIQLTVSKFRATTSIETYNSEDGGYTEQVITGHTKQIQDKNYVNENPRSNHKILSQGIQVIEELTKCGNLDEAKETVKVQNNLSVLSYAEYIKARKPTNINGLFCNDSTPSSDALISHRTSLKYSMKLNIPQEVSISCYQYDLCPLCKNAMLVEDVHSIYKLISFIECLQELQVLHPDNQKLAERIEIFKDVLNENIDVLTIQEAETKLINEGRYPLLKSTYAVTQYL